MACEILSAFVSGGLLSCCTAAQIDTTVHHYYYAFHWPSIKKLVEKLFCSFFNPVISLYIYYDQYEKIWRKNKKTCFPAVGFNGNGGHIRF